MAKKKIVRTVEIKCPIRLMFGIVTSWTEGFSVVYEKKDKSAGALSIWYTSDPAWGNLFRKVRFIGKGTNRVVFEVITTQTRRGPKVETRVKEILIRKDFQIK